MKAHHRKHLRDNLFGLALTFIAQVCTIVAVLLADDFLIVDALLIVTQCLLAAWFTCGIVRTLRSHWNPA